MAKVCIAATRAEPIFVMAGMEVLVDTERVGDRVLHQRSGVRLFWQHAGFAKNVCNLFASRLLLVEKAVDDFDLFGEVKFEGLGVQQICQPL